MNIEQVFHVLREIHAITKAEYISVFGGNSVLFHLQHTGTSDIAELMPAEYRFMKLNANAGILNDGLAESVNQNLGEGSAFHQAHGYYTYGMQVSNKTLPVQSSWTERASIFRVPGSEVKAIVPAVEDLVLAKLMAGRKKDVVFFREVRRVLPSLLEKVTLRLLDFEAENVTPEAREKTQKIRKFLAREKNYTNRSIAVS